MRVLVFTNELKLGGSELVALNAASGLVRQHVDTRLIAARGNADPFLEKQYALENRVRYCDFPRLRIKNFKKISEQFKYLVDEIEKIHTRHNTYSW